MANTIEIIIRATDKASDIVMKVDGKIAGAGKSIGAGFDQVGTKMDKLIQKMGGLDKIADKMQSVGKKMTIGVTLPIAGLAAVATKMASDLNETMNKVDTLFGDQAKEIKAWASTADKALGQSTRVALDGASSMALFAKSAGLAGQDVTDFAKRNVQLASDMASFFNTSPEDALQAIGAAFRGEMEPIRRYNVLLDDASLRQEALTLGLIKTTKEALTPQQKVLAAQALIMKQTTAAQGDFIKTSDGLANSTRITTAMFENAAAKLGQNLLPVATDVVHMLNGLLEGFSGLSPETQKLIIAFGGIAAAAGPVLSIGGKLIDVGKQLKGLFALLGSSAVPIAAIVAGLAAIVTYLIQVGDAAKKTNDELIQMSQTGDLFQKAAASTEILLHGQDRLKKTLDDVNQELAKSTRSYSDYEQSLRATAEAAGYQIDAQGNLIQVSYGMGGRVEKLVQANYLLSESQREVVQTSEAVTQGAKNQADVYTVLDGAMQGVTSTSDAAAGKGSQFAEMVITQGEGVYASAKKQEEAMALQKAAFDAALETQAKFHQMIGETIQQQEALATSLSKVTAAEATQKLAEAALGGLKEAYDKRTISAQEYEGAVQALQIRYGLATPQSIAMAKAQGEVTDAFLAGKLPLKDYLDAADLIPRVASDGVVSTQELIRLGLKPLDGQFIDVKRSVDNFILSLQSIPTSVNTTIGVTTVPGGTGPTVTPRIPRNVPQYQHGGDFIVPPNPRGGGGDYYAALFAPGERVTATPAGQRGLGSVQIENISINVTGSNLTPEKIEEAVLSGIVRVFNEARQ